MNLTGNSRSEARLSEEGFAKDAGLKPECRRIRWRNPESRALPFSVNPALYTILIPVRAEGGRKIYKQDRKGALCPVCALHPRTDGACHILRAESFAVR